MRTFEISSSDHHVTTCSLGIHARLLWVFPLAIFTREARQAKFFSPLRPQRLRELWPYQSAYGDAEGIANAPRAHWMLSNEPTHWPAILFLADRNTPAEQTCNVGLNTSKAPTKAHATPTDPFADGRQQPRRKRIPAIQITQV